jgi:SAM-dependent methyltransferase
MSDDPINWNIVSQERDAEDKESGLYPGVGDVEVFAKLPFNGKILDLGSNICRWYTAFKWFKTLDMERSTIDYYAYDYSETAKRIAKDLYPEIKFICGDVFELSKHFVVTKFDTLFTAAFIQHFSNENKIRIFKQIQRILKPGAHYIMVEQIQLTPENYTNDRSFSVTGWHIFLSQFEFHPVKVELPYLVYKYG